MSLFCHFLHTYVQLIGLFQILEGSQRLEAIIILYAIKNIYVNKSWKNDITIEPTIISVTLK